jgi:glycine hydroxymethyltransferase
MNLAHGGHLTHGSPVSFSGKDFNIVSYGVDKESETIDYDDAACRLALEHKPGVIVAGASAYPRVLDFRKFRTIADEAGALLITDMAHISPAWWPPVSILPRCRSPTSPPPPPTKPFRGPRGGMVLGRQGYRERHGHRGAEIRPDEANLVRNHRQRRISRASRADPLMHIIAAKAVAFREALAPEISRPTRSEVKVERPGVGLGPD